MSHWKIGVKIRWKLKYGGQNSIFFSWNPWSKFYVPWKGGSKFYIFSQCLEKGGSKPRSLPTNFTEGVHPPPPPPPPPTPTPPPPTPPPPTPTPTPTPTPGAPSSVTLISLAVMDAPVSVTLIRFAVGDLSLTLKPPQVQCGINWQPSSPPGQNGRHFPDDIFKSIFMNEKFCILIWISLNFVPKGPINIISAMVQIMALRWSGDKPLYKPMLTWFTDHRFTDAYIGH